MFVDLVNNPNVDGLLEIFNSFELVKSEIGDIETFIENTKEIYIIINEAIDYDKVSLKNEEEALDFLESSFNENNDDSIKEVMNINNIAAFSTALFLVSPEFYVPYLFSRQFYLINQIYSEFGIYLPPVYNKKDQIGRIKYYWELCKSIRKFALQYEISVRDIPVFLYGFAPNIIDKFQFHQNLPPPRRAFFVGGGINNNGDFYYLDNASEDAIYNWQGNPETEPGDIIVMYCLSPRSYIHSIWRAVSPGSVDPFFYFFRNVYIGYPILVAPITWNEIKNDPILKEYPLVKGNMQGINGRNIPNTYYKRIMEILQDKNQNIELLPQLNDTEVSSEQINDERDVEKHLLEPLLKRLNYSENIWVRQMNLRMGRGEKVYPDYVIFPEMERNNERGEWIWEAKYSISNHKQLFEDFGQAKSYALRLQAKGLGLVSIEGIWICKKEFTFENLKFWSWNQVKQVDLFNEIFELVGNKIYKN